MTENKVAAQNQMDVVLFMVVCFEPIYPYWPWTFEHNVLSDCKH